MLQWNNINSSMSGEHKVWWKNVSNVNNQNNYNVFGYDKAGNLGSSGLKTVSLDINKTGSIIINSPENGNSFASTSISFNFSVVDYVKNSIDCVVNIDGGKNNVIANNNTDYTLDRTLQYGIHNWNVSCSNVESGTAEFSIIDANATSTTSSTSTTTTIESIVTTTVSSGSSSSGGGGGGSSGGTTGSVATTVREFEVSQSSIESSIATTSIQPVTTVSPPTGLTGLGGNVVRIVGSRRTLASVVAILSLSLIGYLVYRRYIKSKQQIT